MHSTALALADDNSDSKILYLFSSDELIQGTEGRRNAYRAIVQARPSHLNNIYLATQV